MFVPMCSILYLTNFSVLLYMKVTKGFADISSFMSFADAVSILPVASNQNPKQNWFSFYSSSVIILPYSGRNCCLWYPLMFKSKHRKWFIRVSFLYSTRKFVVQGLAKVYSLIKWQLGYTEFHTRQQSLQDNSDVIWSSSGYSNSRMS